MNFSKLCLLIPKSEYSYEQELHEPLRKPEDIIHAVNRSKTSGDHSEIHQILRNRNINLRSAIEEDINGKKQKRTIARKLLEDVVNGDKIVKRELDIHVKTTSDKEDSIDYGLQIDFEGIFSEEYDKQTMVIYDLLDLHVERRSENNESFTSLIKHPVIATFILAKWKKTRWYFYITSTTFLIFLLLYSVFVLHLFTRSEGYCSDLEIDSEIIGRTIVFPEGPSTQKQECGRNQTRISKKFLSEWDNNFSILEAFFLAFLIFLFGMEIYQAFKLKKQYFKELENYIEWVVLVSALITMIKKEALLENSSQASIVRGVAAIGIFAAWFELIFIIGRYPFRGGDFSIMFYNIIKKIARYVFAMSLMILGFAFAFMVVNYGHNQNSFDNPIKSFMMTLTMALGEF
eukprot:GFUD01092606.1.p1 GENE.GFUD01092606.1~~GFUD01092606.1.p1  ORF type:complete len:402 (-),score=71.74 GFUD01092606.1:169-1374(-)